MGVVFLRCRLVKDYGFLKTDFKSKELSSLTKVRCYSLHGKDHVRYMDSNISKHEGALW